MDGTLKITGVVSSFYIPPTPTDILPLLPVIPDNATLVVPPK